MQLKILSERVLFMVNLLRGSAMMLRSRFRLTQFKTQARNKGRKVEKELGVLIDCSVEEEGHLFN